MPIITNLNEYIQKAIKIHGIKYDYSESAYLGSNKNITIKCKSHGYFTKIAHSHLYGLGCLKCKREEIFIEKCIKKYGSFYIYEEGCYIGAFKPINITCPTHGDFKLSQAAKHLNRNQTCSKCHNYNKKPYIRKLREYPTNKFIEDAKKIHGDSFDYSKSISKGSNDKIIIICKEHGEFLQKRYNHLKGNGCLKCTLDKKSIISCLNTKEFIKKGVITHNNKYDYSLTEYKNKRSKVKIICPIHGVFEQSAMIHLKGHNCRKCSYKNMIGFSKSQWVSEGYKKLGTFYIIRCWNEKEDFYKAGITFNTVKSRYKSKVKMPYNWELVKEVKSSDLAYIWDLEKRFIKSKKKNYYKPKIFFRGYYHECFK